MDDQQQPLHPHAMSLAKSSSSVRQLKSLKELVFVNRFSRELTPDSHTPGDPLQSPQPDSNPLSHSPRQVYDAHYSYVLPETCPSPVLMSVSPSACKTLHLTVPQSLENQKEWTHVFSGNAVPPRTNPWALAYAGHQFGAWAGQLGDGRAITLGQIDVPEAEKQTPWELQLKGAGLTPYSRFADGYAVVRSSIREYLCSEAMFHLSVPTSRALCLIGSSRDVEREVLEKGALVTRFAPSWIRFGNFELFFSRGDLKNLKLLADFTIRHHFPEAATEGSEENSKYILWLKSVIDKTAFMIAKWQSVGFCHGVMNTDNFSVLGLTIDYGPFQFLDAYDPEYICNHSDHEGRYSFDNQPGIGMWNLTRFATAISPLVVEEFKGQKEKAQKMLVEALQEYPDLYSKYYNQLMFEKFGLPKESPGENFGQVVEPLLDILKKHKIDYTLFFRGLSYFSVQSFDGKERDYFANLPSSDFKDSVLLANPDLKRWYSLYSEHLKKCCKEGVTDSERHSRMRQVNPRVILRNYLAQRVIDESERELRDYLSTGGDGGVGSSGKEGCSFKLLNEYLRVLSHPFEEDEDSTLDWTLEPPEHARHLKCSCSS